MKLSVNEAAFGLNNFVKFDYLDLKTTGFLSTIGAANQRKIGSLPAGSIIDLVAVINTVAEAGASDLTLDVGTTGADPDEGIDNLDLDGITKAAFNTGDSFAVTATGATVGPIGILNNTTGAVDILMELNGTVSNLTAGEWVIAWRQLDLGSLA
jgi:hypothetical protein|tara:strand:- start:435 stop:896 length:462 start_codon:yes stop_codon:yes gene_type:complete